MSEEIYRVEIVNSGAAVVEEKKDHPVQKFWRPAAAAVYLFVCVFDFVLVPSWVGFHSLTLVEKVEAVKELDSKVQQVVLTQSDTWDPLTLKGGGLFHLAFGALLTGAAVTRGLEKTAKARK